MGDLITFQIAGYKDSGKTTLITKLIARLKEERYEPAVLKHHGHGGEPDFSGSRDSERHFAAGAAASLVEGDGHIQLLAKMTRDEFTSVPSMLGVLRFFNPDIILIEGYKHDIYPKAVLLRSEEDLPLLKELTNIQAIIAWPDALEGAEAAAGVLPLFEIGSPSFLDWFINDYIPKAFSELDRSKL